MIDNDKALSTENIRFGGARTVFKVALGVGLAFVALGFLLGWMKGDNLKHFFHAYLLNFCYFLSISLGALFFVTLQHLTRAGWSTSVRRLAELMAATFGIMAVLLLPIILVVLLGRAELYPWLSADFLEHHPNTAHKTLWLNPVFFVVRCLIYFALWIGLSRYFLRRSLEQDESGDPQHTLRCEWLSAPAMLIYSFSSTFAAFDLIMSLEPDWFSTIFGVYFFAGSAIGFFAFVILFSLTLQVTGRLKDVITVEHYHDLGKFLFGFVFFWGYIAFSQYMLIWYADMPEETFWILKRQEGDWIWVSLILIFGHLLIPFVGLLSRRAKRRLEVLAMWSVWMLVMHWIDMYWLVMPALQDPVTKVQFDLAVGQPPIPIHLPIPFHLMDVVLFVGLGGVFVAGLAHQMIGRRLVPVKDPRLGEALAFENF